jgi:precorrin-6B methylase 1
MSKAGDEIAAAAVVAGTDLVVEIVAEAGKVATVAVKAGGEIAKEAIEEAKEVVVDAMDGDSKEVAVVEEEVEVPVPVAEKL